MSRPIVCLALLSLTTRTYFLFCFVNPSSIQSLLMSSASSVLYFFIIVFFSFGSPSIYTHFVRIHVPPPGIKHHYYHGCTAVSLLSWYKSFSLSCLFPIFFSFLFFTLSPLPSPLASLYSSSLPPSIFLSLLPTLHFSLFTTKSTSIPIHTKLTYHI